jgi:hypothetical protein
VAGFQFPPYGREPTQAPPWRWADFDIADPKWWYEIFDAHIVKISIVVV